MSNPTFSILISTKNRLADLNFTLDKINYLIQKNEVECVVFDDGSTDGTFEYVTQNFPGVKIQKNHVSKGYIYCRNKMLNETKADYAISLDDDAHFITENPLESIQNFFETNPKCGLIALRIFWGLEEPNSVVSNEQSHQVQGFVGCAHAWRMKAWRDIPNYPEWFVFYGEENFASYQLFKKNCQVHYLPQVLAHHRVAVKSRKNDADYALRLRRSLSSSWYLLFLFYPIIKIPRKFTYSIVIQFKKVIKGNFKVLEILVLAFLDLVCAIPKIIKNSNRLSKKEYVDYVTLPETKIYWQPSDKQFLNSRNRAN
jgi:glycosyltransferase involved in cell wall biosynthesis